MDFSRYLELNKNSLADFHTHTSYCDGGNTTAEMATAAFAQGLKVYGFSGHGYTPYDESYCMLLSDQEAYEAEVRALAAEYAGRMEILCGVEQDCLAGTPTRDWDYVIGSVHYIDCSPEGGGIVVIDETKEIWQETARAAPCQMRRIIGSTIRIHTSMVWLDPRSSGEGYHAERRG